MTLELQILDTKPVFFNFFMMLSNTLVIISYKKIINIIYYIPTLQKWVQIRINYLKLPQASSELPSTCKYVL